jgi:hypothetical protein
MRHDIMTPGSAELYQPFGPERTFLDFDNPRCLAKAIDLGRHEKNNL